MMPEGDVPEVFLPDWTHSFVASIPANMLAAKSVLKQSAQHSERISSFAVTALSNPALYPQARTAFVQLLVRVFVTHLFIHCDGSQGVRDPGPVPLESAYQGLSDMVENGLTLALKADARAHGAMCSSRVNHDYHDLHHVT